MSKFKNSFQITLCNIYLFTYYFSGHADTGLALQYALDIVLRTSNGDRRASNVLIVITDSEASNDETVYINFSVVLFIVCKRLEQTKII